MADNTAKTVLSIIATTSDRIKNLIIKDGQLIFCPDKSRIAFDFKGVRTFYNQIVELSTDKEREDLISPVTGYYFVINEAVLWYYDTEWIQITTKPEEVIFIGVELPQLGQENKLYANTTSGNENISVWVEELGGYVVVADKTQEATNEDIENLFK